MVPVWQLQPSLWHPTLSPQPTHLLWLCSSPHAAGAPKPEQQSRPERFCKGFPYTGIKCSQATHPHLGLVEEELCSVVFRNFKDKALEPWLLVLKQSFTCALNISAHLSEHAESGVPS